MSVLREKVEQARIELASGKLGHALGTLSDVVDMAKEPDLLVEVRDLSAQGLSQAGRFSRGSWKRMLAESEKRLAAVQA